MNLLPRFQVFWDGIAARERALILFGVAVLLPVGLYLYVWQPVVAERARLSLRVVELRGELTQLRAWGEEVKRLRAQAPARGGVTLEVAARQAALRFGLPDAAGGLTAQGGDRLLVNLDGVAFDAWLRWLGELGGQGVSLVACQIESLPTPGLVRIKATLSRAAS